MAGLGIPWHSSGEDSALSLMGAWVQSLVSKVRFYKPHSMAKKKKKASLGKLLLSIADRLSVKEILCEIKLYEVCRY